MDMPPQNENMGNVTIFNRAHIGNLVAYSGVMFLLGIYFIISNVLVITATLRTPKLRKRTGIFVCSLAAADICTGIYTPLFWLLGKIAMPEKHGNLVCGFYIFMQIHPLSTSIVNLVLIALDRYLAIVFPLKSRGILTSQHCKQMAVAGWIFAMVLNVPSIPWNQYPGSGPCSLFYMSPGFFFYIIHTATWLSLVAMIFMYVSVVIKVRQHIKFMEENAHRASSPPACSDKLTEAPPPPTPRDPYKKRGLPSSTSSEEAPLSPSSTTALHPQRPSQDVKDIRSASMSGNTGNATLNSVRAQKKFKHEVNLTKLVCLVLGVFCLCWIPMMVLYSIYMAGNASVYNYASAAGLLAFLNSGMNFILYTLRSKDYRIAFKEILTCKSPSTARTTDYYTNSTSGGTTPNV